jgi:UDP-N-acetylmuramoylalanine--D-glutamate ligase
MRKKALVVGWGVSGKSAAKFLLSLGYEVCGTDRKTPRELLLDIPFFEEHAIDSLKGFDLLVLSPGIPLTHFLPMLAKKEGIEIIGEAELAFRHLRQIAVAITGTNGKTTVTSLVEHVLTSCGRKAKAVGNIGTALTEYALSAHPEEIAVVELSSYQLETLESSPFVAAVILNITPDHLDRYSSLMEYAQAKVKIEQSIQPGGTLYVYEETAKEYGPLFTKPFESFSGDFKESSFSGHDLVNVTAAWLLCSRLGITRLEFSQALQTFQKPSHRIEFVKEIAGVQYYDDSKGTNVDAVIKAVSSMKGSVVLIAGGVDKGSSYFPWKEAFQGKIKNLLVIGEAAKKIESELGSSFSVQVLDSLEDAVQRASQIAEPGDSVLLSPGCSSFDMFRDYVHRGQEFQRYVCSLEERREIS